jgi:hypothetical protein
MQPVYIKIHNCQIFLIVAALAFVEAIAAIAARSFIATVAHP